MSPPSRIKSFETEDHKTDVIRQDSRSCTAANSIRINTKPAKICPELRWQSTLPSQHLKAGNLLIPKLKSVRHKALLLPSPQKPHNSSLKGNQKTAQPRCSAQNKRLVTPTTPSPKISESGKGRKEAAAVGMSQFTHAQPSWRPILQHSHVSSSFQKIIPILCVLEEER